MMPATPTTHPRNLLSHEMWLYRDHLLRLSDTDRNLRFMTRTTDDAIARYVTSIDLRHSVVKALFATDLSIAAAAHIAIAPDGKTAEIGLSVDQTQRGRGLGSKLFEAAVLHLRTRGVKTVVMTCLRRNATMMRIARREDMNILFHADEVEAALPIDTNVRVMFRWQEIISELKGWASYHHFVTARAVRAMIP